MTPVVPLLMVPLLMASLATSRSSPASVTRWFVSFYDLGVQVAQVTTHRFQPALHPHEDRV